MPGITVTYGSLSGEELDTVTEVFSTDLKNWKMRYINYKQHMQPDADKRQSVQSVMSHFRLPTSVLDSHQSLWAFRSRQITNGDYLPDVSLSTQCEEMNRGASNYSDASIMHDGTSSTTLNPSQREQAAQQLIAYGKGLERVRAFVYDFESFCRMWHPAVSIADVSSVGRY